MSDRSPSRPGSTMAPANGARRWWILAVIGTAQLMAILDDSVVAIALPSAQADLGFGNANRHWVITAYALAFGALLLLGGRLIDLIGAKKVFVSGIVGFAVASAVGGAAGNFAVLVAARAGQGVFAAMLAPAALALLSLTFGESADRGKAFGIFGAIGGAGGALGLLLGGTLTDYLSWRWCLYVNLVFAAVALIGALLWLPSRSGHARPNLDLPGAGLISVSLFSLVFGLSEAGRSGWHTPSTWAFLIAGAALLGLFVHRLRTARDPLLPLTVLLDRTRGASFLVIFIAGIGTFALSLFLTYYLQRVRGFSPLQTGVAFLPLVAAIVTSSVLATAKLLPRAGARATIPLGMGLLAVALLWLATVDVQSSYPAHLLPAMILAGSGIGTAFGPAINLATHGVDPADLGVASATVNTTQQIGGSIGTALLNTIASTAAARYAVNRPPTAQTLAHANVHSYSIAFLSAAALFVIGLVAAALIYPRHP